ncbi:MAG: methyl-accepting chemotaxis protein, partial [Burkholderiales bacterium]
ILGEGKDEVSQVASVLERMRLEMLSIISNRHWASENLSTTSFGLLHGDSNLCPRTNGQASLSQETASLAGQLGGAVLPSAENAGQASVLANSASGVAVKGRDTVNQAVGTMSETQELSKKIAEVIGAIDAIAFQTNGLALNAVVEATCVGERGCEGLQALPPRRADYPMSELIAAKYAAADTTVSSQIRTQQHY